MSQHQLTTGPLLVERVTPAGESTHPSKGEKVSLTRLLVEACADTGLSEKDAAISQGYDPRYWPRIKSGEKAAHLERISGLPERTQRVICERWARMLGLRVSTADSQRTAAANLIKAAADFIAESA